MGNERITEFPPWYGPVDGQQFPFRISPVNSGSRVGDQPVEEEEGALDVAGVDQVQCVPEFRGHHLGVVGDDAWYDVYSEVSQHCKLPGDICPPFAGWRVAL